MERLLDFAQEKGAKIINKSNGNPQLVIIGEEHLLLKIIFDPRIFFTEMKPQYFFCEGVSVGEELDYKKYSSLPVPRPEEKLKKGTFEKLIHDTFYDEGTGYCGKAITEGFGESPETVFVGMDLRDSRERSYRIIDSGKPAIQTLDDFLADMLHVHPGKLSDKEYQQFEQMREFLYRIREQTPIDAYELVDKINDIRAHVPQEILRKARIDHSFRRTEKATYVYNRDRETTMAKTMVQYAKQSAKSTMAVVGAKHIEPDSHIFPILDNNSIRYVAIDIWRR